MACEIALGVFMGMIGYRFVMGEWLLDVSDSVIARFIFRCAMALLFVWILTAGYVLMQSSGGTA